MLADSRCNEISLRKIKCTRGKYVHLSDRDSIKTRDNVSGLEVCLATATKLDKII